MNRLPMSSAFSALRRLLLVVSLLLTPQMALLHALSHATIKGTAAAAVACDEPCNAADASEHCPTCLGLAQLGAALPVQPLVHDAAGVAPLSHTPASVAAAQRKLAVLVARGPPTPV